jgi:hypothetical protein
MILVTCFRHGCSNLENFHAGQLHFQAVSEMDKKHSSGVTPSHESGQIDQQPTPTLSTRSKNGQHHRAAIRISKGTAAFWQSIELSTNRPDVWSDLPYNADPKNGAFTFMNNLGPLVE